MERNLERFRGYEGIPYGVFARRRHDFGKTLIELLTTLALLAVIGMLAAPGLSGPLYDARRASIVNELFHALFLARSEAVKRGAIVTVCQSADGLHCAGNAARWTSGWIVFANLDRDEPPVRDPQEPIIASYGGWAHGSITSSRASYSFRPNTQGVVNGTIVFCDQRGPAHARAIVINHAGRPRVTDRDASSRALRCPPGQG
jgi:type IV fimbrial biogenesis protein FimT